MCCGEKHGHHGMPPHHAEPSSSMRDFCGCGGPMLLGKKEMIETLERYREALKGELQMVDEKLKELTEG